MSLVSQAAAGLLWGCSPSSSGSLPALSPTLAVRFKRGLLNASISDGRGLATHMAPLLSWERDAMNEE